MDEKVNFSLYPKKSENKKLKPGSLVLVIYLCFFRSLLMPLLP